MFAVAVVADEPSQTIGVAVEHVRVMVQANDPLTVAELACYLQWSDDVVLLPNEQHADADVVVVAAERLTLDVLYTLRRATIEIGTPIVLIIDEVSEAHVSTLAECGVVAILPRTTLTGERFLRSVFAAAAGGDIMPPNLAGELRKQVQHPDRNVDLTGQRARDPDARIV